MRMLFVADLHYALKQFDWLTSQAPLYDLLIIGGDVLELASSLDIDVQIVVVEKYLNKLRQLTRVVVCSGNHDGNHRNHGNESVARWLTEAKAPQLYVDGDSLEIGDTLITVCPWWDGPISRAALQAQLDSDSRKPKAKWIWVHHAPPDQTAVSWTGRKFGGDEFLVQWIKLHQPDLVLSGHIHNAPFYAGGSWIDRIGRTWVFNPGRQLGANPTSLTLDLCTMAVAWRSIENAEEKILTAGMNCLPNAPIASAGA